MFRSKLGLLGLCAAVLGAMAISASAAQGALWWLILNAAKTTATELKAALTGKNDSTHLTLDAELTGFKVAVTCTAFTLNNVNLEVFGKLTEGGKAVFTGCKVYKTAPLTEEYKCTVNTTGAAAGTVESNGFKGALQLVSAPPSNEIMMKIEPIAGPTGNLATLSFKGAECILPELNQLHGTLYLRDPFVTKHSLEHLIEPEWVNTNLYIGGHSAEKLFFTRALGSAWVKLAGAHSGLDWGVLDF
jgi:hypothetical protein